MFLFCSFTLGARCAITPVPENRPQSIWMSGAAALSATRERPTFGSGRRRTSPSEQARHGRQDAARAPGKFISIRGAREHNLKNIDLDLPRDSLIVITGLSGSGKSSLAFDTIYAEGQRRYVESLSAYARQFLEMMQKPDVDQIDGLSPAISIEQKTTSRNPRSTVGTVTEIYDYMRLLWARVGVPYSPATGLPIESQTVSQMVDRVHGAARGHAALSARADRPRPQGRVPQGAGRAAEARLPARQDRRHLLRDRRGAGARQEVQARHRGGGRPHRRPRRHRHPPRRLLRDRAGARRRHRHRRVRRRARATAAARRPPRKPKGREGEGRPPTTSDLDDRRHEARRHRQPPNRIVFSEKFACPVSGFTIAEIEPRLFSFNNPYGACPVCDGLGAERDGRPGPGRPRRHAVAPRERHRALGQDLVALLPADAGGARPPLRLLDRHAVAEAAGEGARRHPLRHRRGGGHLHL